jgi:hypothetical protein
MRRASRGRFVSPASLRDVRGTSGGVGRVFEGADGSDAGGVVGWPFVTGAGEAMVDMCCADIRDQIGVWPSGCSGVVVWWRCIEESPY